MYRILSLLRHEILPQDPQGWVAILILADKQGIHARFNVFLAVSIGVDVEFPIANPHENRMSGAVKDNHSSSYPAGWEFA